LITKFNRNTISKPSISGEITSLVAESDFARLKIIHDENLNPLAYAVGFGCAKNSSLIVGGTEGNKFFVQGLLMKLAKTLSEMLSQNKSLLGIDIRKLFIQKGIWIIPSFNSVCVKNSLGFISERIDPKRLMEIHANGEGIKYNFGNKTPANSRLFAYILASSSGYSLDATPCKDENSLCKWFVSELSRQAYLLELGRNSSSCGDTLDEIFDRVLEAFLVFIAA